MLVGALIAAAGLAGVADPSVPLAFARQLQSTGDLYMVAAIRVLMGAALVWAAPGSRMPRTLRVIGVLMIIGGLVSPFFGVARVQELLSWFSSLGPLLMRAGAGIAAALGIFIAYSARPRKH